jgi:ribokinase
MLTRETRETRPLVTVVGSLNLDVTYFVRHLPQPGETLLAEGTLSAVGGKGANQALAASAHNVEVGLVGRVGDDAGGLAAVQHLEARGIGARNLLPAPATATGSAVILVADSGENSIVVNPGANFVLTPLDVRAALADSKPSVVLAQLEIPTPSVLEAAKSSSGLFILNPAPSGSAKDLAEVLSVTDLLVPNRSELASLCGSAEPRTLEELTFAVRSLPFGGTVVVTLGSEGVIFFAESPLSKPVHVPPIEVSPIDTSGAGDAFCGTLAAALASGCNIAEAVKHANRFASWSVTQKGAQISLPPPESVTRY